MLSLSHHPLSVYISEPLGAVPTAPPNNTTTDSLILNYINLNHSTITANCILNNTTTANGILNYINPTTPSLLAVFSTILIANCFLEAILRIIVVFR